MARSDERGQVLVVVALALVVLLGAAAFTIDLGRRAAEERFLQNAADAGALAGCNALVDGATQASALQRSREVATYNLANSPGGTSASIAGAGAEEYVDGYHGNPYQLLSGAVYDSASTSIFVAIRSDVGTTVGRVLGREALPAAGRARCTLEPQPMLPFVARRYQNPPNGPGFIDHVATAATSTTGTADATNPRGYNGRVPASETEPGPIFQLFGPNSQATNNSFRGFVALDVRDFTSTASRQYYNGATEDMNSNTLKAHHSRYVSDPYPGPPIPAVQTPPTGATQIGIMNGVSAAHSTQPFDTRFSDGNRLMLALYDGTVMSIPDFAIRPPNLITLPPTTTTPANGPSFRISKNNAFNSPVTLSLAGDENATDPAYNILPDPPVTPPDAGMMDEPTFSPNNFVPGSGGAGTSVAMQSISTNDIPEGVYTVWIEGQAGAPYNQFRRQPVPVRVGTVNRDFSLQGTFDGETPTLGGTITLPIKVVRSGSDWHDGSSASTTPVSLSWDTSSLTTCNHNPIAIGTGTISIGPSSVTPTAAGAASTITINAGSLSSGCYLFTLRATGVNADGQPVTRLQEVQFSVAPASGPSDYIDIIGFAVFEVVDTDNNEIWAKAITGIYADPEDLALKAALRPRLIPWN